MSILVNLREKCSCIPLEQFWEVLIPCYVHRTMKMNGTGQLNRDK